MLFPVPFWVDCWSWLSCTIVQVFDSGSEYRRQSWYTLDLADILNIIEFMDDCCMLDRIVLEYCPSVLSLKVLIKFQCTIGGGGSWPLLAEEGIWAADAANHVHNNSYPLIWEMIIVVHSRCQKEYKKNTPPHMHLHICTCTLTVKLYQMHLYIPSPTT